MAVRGGHAPSCGRGTARYPSCLKSFSMIPALDLFRVHPLKGHAFSTTRRSKMFARSARPFPNRDRLKVPMHSVPKIAEVQQEIDRISQATGSVEDFMWEVVKVLHDRMLKYNWVGFYMLEQKSADGQPRMLVLGPFQGAMTPHTRIPLNQGICG